MKPRFQEQHPLAWTFHRATSRWSFNSIGPAHEAMPTPGREHPQAPWQALPAAGALPQALGDALAARRSCRRFAQGPMRLQDLATLLGAGFGVKARVEFGAHQLLSRPHPSGGGLYALELTLLVRAVDGIEPGVYHYAVAMHGLEQLRQVKLPADLVRYLFMGQDYAAEAALVCVLSADFERCMGKYGDRGYRYLLLEAGHAVQNLNLIAAALGLGSCNLGGFFDVELSDLLRLDLAREQALYAVAVGPEKGPEIGPDPTA